ncbi:rifin [Plasmodium reichenowi]|uniref:Rifin n=1 Tax=Plasmodium reichenowi TaxID=5854 RepID=A0A060RZ84_PLARE|nr:rifin [Plasmodium reichenowi]
MFLHIILMNKLLFLLAYWHLQWSCYTLHHIRRIEKIITSRGLSEINLYEPNYDNDPEMKKVMDNFNRRTEKRFEELNERIKEKRKKYNKKCDNDIKEIIVKDKIEKQLIKKFSALENVSDPNHLHKGKSKKKVTHNVQKCSYKKRKSLRSILTEWDILDNIDMYEWIPFCSTEENSDGSIKNIKDAITKVGYIGSNNSIAPEKKGVKDTTGLRSILSSILGSSNSLFQKYIDENITSDGSSFKKQSSFASFIIYGLSEIVEHVVVPVVTTLFFGNTGDVKDSKSKPAGNNSSGEESQVSTPSCSCKDKSECTCKCTGTCVCKCVCKNSSEPAITCACVEKCKDACQCATSCACAKKCVSACVCAEKCVAACECACAHHSHNHMFIIPISSESFIAAYTIASILLFLYFILQFYRKIRMEKKQKYLKLLKE